MRKLLSCVMLACTALGGAAFAAPADLFPSRPVTLVVPFPPGGPTDALARRLAEGVKNQLNQSVIVENRAGAGGNIGAEYVANADADGYTILFGTSGPLAINVSLYKGQQYDPRTSFEPIIRIGHLPNILVVHPSTPASNVQELIAYAKQHPAKLSYASSGNGASSHLAGILFNKMAGTDILHIPYKGTGPALNDLLGAQVSMSFTDILTALPHVQAGKLRAIGVSNFEQVDLDNILDNGTIKPEVNQILAHVGNTPFDLIDYTRSKGILVEAYSPVAHGEILHDSNLAVLAEKYGVSVAQLCIRYCLQLGMLPLPKTVNPQHMRSNAAVEFEISHTDMETLKNADRIKNYGEASRFPVYGGNMQAGS